MTITPVMDKVTLNMADKGRLEGKEWLTDSVMSACRPQQKCWIVTFTTERDEFVFLIGCKNPEV